MKRIRPALFAITVAVSFCTASLVMAQAEIEQYNPLGLGWEGCSPANPVGAADVVFACATETSNACRVFRLMPTFVSTITDPAFLASTTNIDVLIGSSPTIGQWWAGMSWTPGCRDTAMTIAGNVTAASLPTAGACRNPFPAGAVTNPGQEAIAGTGQGGGPNRVRITSVNTVNPVQPLTTGERTYAMQLEFKTEGTLADCDPSVDPTPVCTDGCTAPACFVLNHVDIFMEVGTGDPNPDIIHYTYDGGATRYWASYQGGTGASCPLATPARPSTWGAIKALYR